MGQCKKSLARTEIATQPPWDMKLEKLMGPGPVNTQKPRGRVGTIGWPHKGRRVPELQQTDGIA